VDTLKVNPFPNKIKEKCRLKTARMLFQTAFFVVGHQCPAICAALRLSRYGILVCIFRRNLPYIVLKYYTVVLYGFDFLEK